MKRKGQGERADLYAGIIDRIVADLAKGVRPWMKPWSAANTTGWITRPLRHNGEAYSGLNVLLLWSESTARGYVSPTWMTFKQALQLDGAVRKGETGTTVIYASSPSRRPTATAARWSAIFRSLNRTRCSTWRRSTACLTTIMAHPNRS
ncbi:hypothetical protein AGR4B_pAt20222 [Agrobacterium tumefaciens str. CFBP 5621]|nr:hypothetical protein AGR4B_pAt20222 [Agrobacterium tumefaciens str. CFBP 5621]